MVKARKYIVKKYFQGIPQRDDFEIVEFELPPLKDGEFLGTAEWISVDPYQRSYNNRYPTPYDQYGFQVSIVEESKNSNYPVGTRVVFHVGWVTHTIFNSAIINEPTNRFYKLPNLQGLSNSLGIGAIGMPGVTAYFGFLEICKPEPGETVVVTGAAGAVGSIVGQIAKIKGCKVIGFAGSDDKVEWLEKELGFDKAFNYKTVDADEVLRQVAPEGIDCYFDNVGGELSSVIINQMNDLGRVSVCGSISAYNNDPKKMPKCTILQPSIVHKQLTIQGFIIWRWFDQWPQALSDLTKWIKEGKISLREHVTEGFDHLYEAFIGMLAGDNTGKAVVKV